MFTHYILLTKLYLIIVISESALALSI